MASKGNKTNFYTLTTEKCIDMYLVARSCVPLSYQPLQLPLACGSYTSVCSFQVGSPVLTPSHRLSIFPGQFGIVLQNNIYGLSLFLLYTYDTIKGVHSLKSQILSCLSSTDPELRCTDIAYYKKPYVEWSHAMPQYTSSLTRPAMATLGLEQHARCSP